MDSKFESNAGISPSDVTYISGHRECQSWAYKHRRQALSAEGITRGKQKRRGIQSPGHSGYIPLAYIINMYDCLFALQYLNSVRQMEGYGSVVFPHCACDSRKEGRVIPIVSFEGFKLQACKEDGTEEVIVCNIQMLSNFLLHHFYVYRYYIFHYVKIL